MKSVTLNVDDELAKRLEQSSEEEKAIMLETLSRLLKDRRTLLQVMDDISEYAKKQGMTEEILNDLLKDES
jgi:hypothetical protein